MPTRGHSRRSPAAPLRGLRVLSLAEQYPGPYATLVLSDLGADVVIVERVRGGDPSRRDPPFFAALNRNKRSVALDLKDPAARDAFLALARRADVMLEGFRPGVMERLRLAYRHVARVNRKIVYASLTGFGQSGPYRDLPGHDLSFQALSGMLHAQIGSPDPEVPWLPLGNLAGGLFATIGILAAVRARDETGRGSHVDVAMLDALVSLMTVPLAAIAGRGRALPLRDPGYGLFTTSDRKLLSLSVWGEDHHWAQLCRATGLDQYADHTFSQRARDSDVEVKLRGVLATRSLASWSRVFKTAGVPFAPVLDLSEVGRHPQVRAREQLVRTSPPGAIRQAVRQPVRFDGASPAPVAGAPELGEHTTALLAAAGVTKRRIEALLASGAASQS